MATLCKNCGYPLVYDPITQNVVCDACGSAFAAESIHAYGKEYEENASPYLMDENGVMREFMECQVYSCNTCGGEIIISGAEVSTSCIYCGSTSVIFSRVSKELRPDFILPFQFNREQATQLIKNRFGSGMFIPKEFKDFQPDSVRGIYIPYWLVDVYHAESDIIRGEVGSGENSSTYYYARAGRMKLNNMLIEASMELNDESSIKLEPFDLRKLKVFDEDYMLGFYSDMSDLTYGELRKVADQRASEEFRKCIILDVKASSRRVVKSQSATLIDKDIKYAMLPAWFVTVQYQGKPHTILVNGESGKVVCGLPWNKKLFWTLVGAVAGGITLVAGLLFSVLAVFFGGLEQYGMAGLLSVFSSMIPFGAPALFFSLIFFLIGFTCYSKVKKQIKLTQATDTFRFTKKRQG